MTSLLRLLALLITIQATATAQDQRRADPMARFTPMVGHWHVRHTIWPPDGGQPEVFEGTARMYVVEGGKVFVVDEVTPDNRIALSAITRSTRRRANTSIGLPRALWSWRGAKANGLTAVSRSGRDASTLELGRSIRLSGAACGRS